ncbi:hypothetical protein PDE_02136 [Penicillium oxalicum 114-2]|uniref:BHLH domain-containing protein n=1 Tax=Penicillium oxalicum (strain 114-2 / CGMCC 5302) TaxID=933388 RepID=S8AMR7_PENO1|nr:hypothetical protein PDE_02136 [Penicillium oxalicum 114-2]
MSYTTNPSSPSASQPTRRDRMASALRILMANDHIDPEILRAGTQWMTAVDIENTQTSTPQATYQPAYALNDPPSGINETPIDPALCTESPFPLESGKPPANPVQSWIGDVYSRPSPSNSLQADPMSYDSTSEFAWISNDWDIMLNSVEVDPSSSAGTSTSMSISNSSVGNSSVGNSSVDIIAQTPLTSPVALPPIEETSMQSPSQLPSAVERQSPVKNSRPRPLKHQRAHYVIEKRYRAGLHERFEALRDCVESWKHDQLQKGQQQSSLPLSLDTTTDWTSKDASRGATRLNKSEVLCEAVAYIKLLQEENEVVMEHMKLLIRRFRATKQALQQG